MMSGNATSRPVWRWLRPGLSGLLLGFLLVGSAGAAVPESGAPTLETLFARLAERRETRVRFVEVKHMSLLTKPLRQEGTLEFRPPDTLAKHVEKPVTEDYVIEQGLVRVSKPGQGEQVTLALRDLPPLEAFVESLRAPLAGDLEALRRHYWRPSLGGSWRHWLLALTPLRPELSGLIRSVTLEGEGDRLTRMTLEETGGDSSTLSFQPIPKP